MCLYVLAFFVFFAVLKVMASAGVLERDVKVYSHNLSVYGFVVILNFCSKHFKFFLYILKLVNKMDR